MTTLDAATQESLRKALYAYMHDYGGESLQEARAIAGSILAVKEKAGDLVAQGLEIEAWVDALVEDFDPTQMAEQMWTEGERAIAAQAHKWRDTVEVKARATLDAYIQKYVPSLDTQKLQGLAATILPIVEDTKISRDEAQRLIYQLTDQFDWQTAASRVIDPRWVMLADKAMQVIKHRDVEDSVMDVMNAYVYKFAPSAVEIGEQLVEEAMQAVTNSRVTLDLDIDLDAETRKLMVKQVMLKFNLMEASPPAYKSAFEIAQQVHDEVARYRREQGLDRINYQPEVTTTDTQDGSSLLGGEMSIGFELQPRSLPKTIRQPDEDAGSSE
jgi:hypothetical protein